MRHGYEEPSFATMASYYYDLEAAIRFFASPVPEGCARWRCVLCGWGCDVGPAAAEIIPATCCGGCGMTTMRPLAEWMVGDA